MLPLIFAAPFLEMLEYELSSCSLDDGSYKSDVFSAIELDFPGFPRLFRPYRSRGT